MFTGFVVWTSYPIFVIGLNDISISTLLFLPNIYGNTNINLLVLQSEPWRRRISSSPISQELQLSRQSYQHHPSSSTKMLSRDLTRAKQEGVEIIV